MEKAGTGGLSGNNLSQIVERIRRYCAIQERCTRDVQQKLKEWKVPENKVDLILKHLEDNNFINEARFAALFTGSKFRLNKWGKVKIRYELKSRSIPEDIIREALDGINGEDYRKTIRELILKKKQEIKTGKNLTIREKIITFVTGKGFEFDLVAGTLKELNI